MLVENGFPLKALEMAAAGLPVVSSLMKPLRHVPQAVTVVDSPEAFHVALASHSRRTRPTADREAAERVCRAYDYDALFERMLGELAPRLEDRPPRPGNLSDLVAGIGLETYRSNLVRFVDAAAGPRPPARNGTSRPTSTTTTEAAIPLLLRYRPAAGPQRSYPFPCVASAAGGWPRR